MSLAVVRSHLNALISPGRPARLGSDIPSVAGWPRIWAALGAPVELALEEAVLADTDDGLLLRGHGAAFDVAGTQISLHFAEDSAGRVAVWLDATPPPGARMDAPGGAITMALSSYQFYADALGHDWEGVIRAMLRLGSVDLPVSARFPDMPGVLTIEAAATGVALPGPAALGAVFGDANPFAGMPFDQSVLDGALVLSDLTIRINLDAQRIDQIAATLDLDRDVVLAPGRFEMSRPSLTLAINQPTDPAMRGVDAVLTGAASFSGLVVEVSASRVASVWRIELLNTPLDLPSLHDAFTVAASPTVAAGLPDGLAALPGVSVQRLMLSYDPGPRDIVSAALAFEISAPLGLFGGAVTLSEISGALDFGAAIGVTGRLSGLLRIGDMAVSAQAEREDAAAPWVISAYLAPGGGLTLSDLIKPLLPAGVAPPDVLTGLALDDVELTVTPAEGALRLRRLLATGWPLSSGPDAPQLTEVRFQKSADGAVSIDVTGDGGGAQSPDFSLHDIALSFTRSADAWSAGGQASATVFTKPMTLRVESQSSPSSAGMSLVWTAGAGAPLELVRFDDGSLVALSRLSMDLERSAAGPSTGDGAAGLSLGLSGDASVVVDGLFALNAAITLEAGPAGPRMAVTTDKPELAPITLPLGAPQDPELALELGPLALALGPEGAVLHGDATVTLRNAPEILSTIMALTPMSGTIEISALSRRITLAPPAGFAVDFPEMALTFGDGARMLLGKPALRVMRYVLDLTHKPSFGAEIDIRLPPTINRVFGVDAHGRAVRTLFNDGFQLLAEISGGVRLKAISSPLAPLTFYRKYGRSWSDWDFGPLGVISIQTPEFAFDNGAWSASVGVERLTEVQAPLWVLKSALASNGFPAALLDAVPDALPLIELDLASPDLYDTMAEMLNPGKGGQVAPEVAALLSELVTGLKQGVARLPDRLREYLTLKIPKSAVLDIAATPAGGFSFNLVTHAGEDLKVLAPMMLGPLPELVGVSFRKIGFGLQASGSVAQIRVDGHLDRFDLPGVIYALATGEGAALSHRYILREVFALAGSGAPIIAPVFYDEIGFEYRDLLGVRLESHWHFPEPDLSLGDMVVLIGAMVRFLTQPPYLLHQSGAPAALPLDFTIGPNFIALPDYLGGAVLGPQTALPSIDVSDSMARVLDGLKTGNVGYLIEAVPLKAPRPGGGVDWIRVGRRDIVFGPLTLEAAWCVTTEEEFVEQILADPDAIALMGAANAAGALTALPTAPAGPTLDHGFIVLLMGRVDLAKIFEFRAQFGLALTASGGLETGVKLIGEAADALRIEISGRIAAKPPSQKSATEIEGRLAITFLDAPLLAVEGFIKVIPDESFEIGVSLALADAFEIAGALRIAKDGVTLSGDVDWRLSPDQRFQGGATATIASDGLRLRLDAKLYQFDAAITIVRPIRRGPIAEFALTPPSTFQSAIEEQIIVIADTATTETQSALSEVEALVKQIGDLDVSISGLKGWVPPLCDRIISAMTSGINRGIDRRWPSKKVWGKRISAPGKGSAKRQAQAAAEPTKRRLRRIKAAALRADQPGGRGELKAAMNDMLRHNTFRFRKKVWGRTITFYTYSPIIPAAEAKQMRAAIGWIDKLPQTNGLKVNAEAVYQRAVDKDAVLSAVRTGVQSGVADQIPIVKSIGATVPLGPLSPKIAIEVLAKYRGADRLFTAEIDLADPVASAQGVAEGFAKSLTAG